MKTACPQGRSFISYEYPSQSQDARINMLSSICSKCKSTEYKSSKVAPTLEYLTGHCRRGFTESVPNLFLVYCSSSSQWRAHLLPRVPPPARRSHRRQRSPSPPTRKKAPKTSPKRRPRRQTPAKTRAPTSTGHMCRPLTPCASVTRTSTLMSSTGRHSKTTTTSSCG